MKDPRVATLLSALDGVPPASLEAASAHLPGELGALLRAVAAALRSQDPEAALQDALSGLPVDPARAGAQLQSLDLGLRAAMDALRGQLDGAVAQTDALASSAEALNQELERLQPGEADPEIAAILARATALARDQGALRAVREATSQGQALTAEIEALLGQARRDPAFAQARLPALEARVRALEASLQATEAARPPLSELEAVVRDLRAVGEQRGQPVAELAVVQAGLVEARLGPRAAETTAAWVSALQAALAARDLLAARVAGQRVQAAAIERQDLPQVAVVAHRIADLAEAQGDLRAAVIARLEEASCLARMPEYQADARRLTEQAVGRARASGDPALVARAELTAGQLSESLGDLAEARRIYRRFLEDRKSDTRHPAEVGRAALHLGRLEARRGAARAARDALGLAYEIARVSGDGLLYAPAVAALLEQLSAADARDAAFALLREAEVLVPSLCGPAAVAVLPPLREHVATRWPG